MLPLYLHVNKKKSDDDDEFPAGTAQEYCCRLQMFVRCEEMWLGLLATEIKWAMRKRGPLTESSDAVECTDNPLHADTRYNNKIRYNDSQHETFA